MKWAVSSVVVVLAASFPSCVTTVRVASGLRSPVFVTAPVGDAARLFVVEQGGTIRTLNLATQQLSTFLNISDQVTAGGEEGLLGLAFHPDFANNRRFYVYHTLKYTNDADRATQVVEYRTNAQNPNIGDPTTARLILKVSDPQSNHNGGWIAFGPDGFLYVAIGDGGNANDTGTGHNPDTGNAQDTTDNLLGKMLRINPDPALDDFPDDPNKNYDIPAGNPFIGQTGDNEIWAYGLRNPWRNSFDRLTGDLWIGDVGQDAREEIDFQLATSTGGENYGWRLREGTIETPANGIGGPKPPGNVDPIYDYAHGNAAFQGESVTGGYVYRGPIASLQGTYFFGDYVRAQIWSFNRSGNTITDLTDWTKTLKPASGSIGNISSFGEDAVGNLYIVDYSDGELYRVTEQSAGAAVVQSVSTSVTKLTSAVSGKR